MINLRSFPSRHARELEAHVHTNEYIQVAGFDFLTRPASSYMWRTGLISNHFQVFGDAFGLSLFAPTVGECVTRNICKRFVSRQHLIMTPKSAEGIRLVGGKISANRTCWAHDDGSACSIIEMAHLVTSRTFGKIE